MDKKIQTCLWIQSDAAEAAKYYLSVFPQATVLTEDFFDSEQSENSAHTVEMEIFGHNIMILNGGPAGFELNEAMSLVVYCEDQEEVDYYWNALIADGGEPSQCGWLKDKYGLSWQVVPNELIQLLKSEDKDIREKAFNNMLEMAKIEVSKLLV